MSLFILLDPLIDDNEFKTHCLFFMALMAFSTVLINGTTAKYLLEWLGLLKMSPQQLDVLQYVLKVPLLAIPVQAMMQSDCCSCSGPHLLLISYIKHVTRRKLARPLIWPDASWNSYNAIC
jgi:hypothetical protein